MAWEFASAGVQASLCLQESQAFVAMIMHSPTSLPTATAVAGAALLVILVSMSLSKLLHVSISGRATLDYGHHDAGADASNQLHAAWPMQRCAGILRTVE